MPSKHIIGIIGLVLLIGAFVGVNYVRNSTDALGAPVSNVFRNILPETTQTYDIGSTTPDKEWNNIFTKDLTVSGTCTGCGGGGGATFGQAWELNPTGNLTPTTTPLTIEISDFQATSTSATSIIVGSLTVNTPTFVVDSSTGKVGIGTTTPVTLLHIGSSTPNSIVEGNQFNSLFVSGDIEILGTAFVNTLAVGGTATGTLNMGGNQIVNAGEITATFFTATSTTATSTMPQLDVTDIQVAGFITISADSITDFAGTGLTVSGSGVLDVDASQTQITAIGTIVTGVWNGTSITNANVDDDLTISSSGSVNKGALQNAGTLSFDWADSEVVDTLTIDSGSVITAPNFVADTTATSTFGGAIDVTEANATSTFSGGIDLSAGCFAIGGVCVGAGTGDVTGPGSATDNAIARFDGTGGKTIQNSGVIIGDTDSITGVLAITMSGASSFTTITSTSAQGGGASASAGGVLNLLSNDGSAMTSGNKLGEIDFGGAISGAGVADTKMIAAFAAENWSASNRGATLVFSTTPNTTSSPIDRLTILENGNVGIATSSPFTALSVVGEIVGSHFTATTTFTSTMPQLDVTDIQVAGFIELASSAITDFIGDATISLVSGALRVIDVVCTDCLNATEIEDIYLFNNGDVGTGVFDFGGTTSFEITNGTAPVVNTLGELAFDSTDNQLLVATSTTPAVIRTTNKLFSFALASTSPEFFSGGVLPLPTERDGYIMTEFSCYVIGGTSIVVNVSDGTNDTDSITCATTNTTDTDISSNSTATAGELMEIQIGTVTGSPDYLLFSVYGTYIRE